MATMLDALFPGKWVQMWYPTGPNPADAACWIKHLSVRGPNLLVRAVVKPGIAATMVRQHNERIMADDN